MIANQDESNISVAIVNFNGDRYISHTLDQVYKNCPFVTEILVVDNSSTDNSTKIIREKYPEVRLIELPENNGPCHARNTAINSALSDRILLLDNDVAPCEECLTSLSGALDTYDDVLVAMPAVCLLYTSPSPRDLSTSRMPSSA